MGFRVEITKTAAIDFDNALNYIVSTLKNPIAAKSLADDYSKVLDILADNPFCFEPFLDRKGEETPYRKCRVKNYSIFYRILGPRVIICRILYSRRDFNAISIEPFKN